MSALAADSTSVAAVARLRAWRADPVRFVRDVFGAIPDAWQEDALRAVASAPKVAMAACKGPGKSCLLAWVVWWFLVCHVDAQVAAVSITADNLRDGLWKEMAVWRSKSPLLQQAFTQTAERIKSTERPETWFASARAFAKDADDSAQSAALAGIHGKHVLIVLDEIGDYPSGVLPTAEAIFATSGQKARLVVAGNPTSTRGPLYGVVNNPVGWHVVTITGDPDDPRRSPRIDLAWARAEIAKHGRENPWVMVNILGLFPPGGTMQLIPANLVTAAMQRAAPELAYRGDARVWGLDPARFGDDEIVLMQRQGVDVLQATTWRNLDGTALGDRVAHLIHEATKDNKAPDAIFVDVGGVGSSVYDRLVALGFDHVVHAVDFGGGASRADLYANKRAEMWLDMKGWLERGAACLPKDPVLAAELQGPEYDFRVVNKRSVYVLESKANMKDRGVPSPNRADALALTFAAPVHPHSAAHRQMGAGVSRHAKTDYDPEAALNG